MGELCPRFTAVFLGEGVLGVCEGCGTVAGEAFGLLFEVLYGGVNGEAFAAGC